MYREMSDQGCVLVIDELSMFHPKVRQALAGSPMVISPNTAVLTVSPFPPAADQPQEILREWLRAQLQGVFDRYASDYDPQCELNVNDECHVRRWFTRACPRPLRCCERPARFPSNWRYSRKNSRPKTTPPSPRTYIPGWRPMIATFYSFKGGVGRSMALANVASLLCERGLRTVMLDFDLEAPGLERFFRSINPWCAAIPGSSIC